MTTWDRYLLGLAAVNWLGRVNGVVRRARQPHLRGDGWFFDVEVPDGFAQGAGRQILREYWLRMLAPIGIELAIWIAALGPHEVHAYWELNERQLNFAKIRETKRNLFTPDVRTPGAPNGSLCFTLPAEAIAAL